MTPETKAFIYEAKYWADSFMQRDGNQKIANLFIALNNIIESQEKEIERLDKILMDENYRAESLEGVIGMAIGRMGGEVDGRPTHRGNFLRRIDELVKKEESK